MSCCPPGCAPYLAADHEDEGAVKNIDGQLCYQVGSGSSGILLLPDVWGWNGGRTRALADDLANQGVSVWVPKMLGPFEGGTDDDGFPPAFDLANRMSELGPLVTGDWSPASVIPKCLKIAKAMDDAGVKQKGWLGFCYGAWIGVHLSKQINFVCGASPHPSVHLEGMVGGDPAQLASEAGCPIAFFPAGVASESGGDPDIYDQGGSVFMAFEEKFKGQNETRRFPNMQHGWVSRGCINPNETHFGTGADVKVAVQKAMDCVCKFFSRYQLMGPVQFNQGDEGLQAQPQRFSTPAQPRGEIHFVVGHEGEVSPRKVFIIADSQGRPVATSVPFASSPARVSYAGAATIGSTGAMVRAGVSAVDASMDILAASEPAGICLIILLLNGTDGDVEHTGLKIESNCNIVCPQQLGPGMCGVVVMQGKQDEPGTVSYAATYIQGNCKWHLVGTNPLIGSKTFGVRTGGTIADACGDIASWEDADELQFKTQHIHHDNPELVMVTLKNNPLKTNPCKKYRQD